VCLLVGDATAPPLKRATVDVLLCDLPFGKMHGSVQENRSLYPRVLAAAAALVPYSQPSTLPSCTLSYAAAGSASVCSAFSLGHVSSPKRGPLKRTVVGSLRFASALAAYANPGATGRARRAAHVGRQRGAHGGAAGRA
jgi:hypothetical protein